MNELEVKRVPFMGTDLMAAKDESGTIWAGVRWMCDGMGLSKGQRDRQITNINADSVISKGAANLRLPTAGGKQSVLCLKLDFVPLWLAKINITPAMQAETPGGLIAGCHTAPETLHSAAQGRGPFLFARITAARRGQNPGRSAGLPVGRLLAP